MFVEEIETSPAAFEALIAAVEQLGASRVVLPSPLHFAVLGPPGAVRYHFERLTGAQVVVADCC
ncbi:hypothetical protein [Kribbella sp. DT2]|uniref:hypothetical protein n=1 Tax=Kribbella sp. DT2 TaxID=3393427 RepID=UPI003CEBEE4C